RTWAARDCATNEFAICIKDRITSSLTCLIVAVNNLVEKGSALCALSFFLQTTRAIVFVAGLKTKMAIRPEDRAAGKATCFIDVVANFLAKFPILAGGGRDGLMLRRDPRAGGRRINVREPLRDLDLHLRR